MQLGSQKKKHDGFFDQVRVTPCSGWLQVNIPRHQIYFQLVEANVAERMVRMSLKVFLKKLKSTHVK